MRRDGSRSRSSESHGLWSCEPSVLLRPELGREVVDRKRGASRSAHRTACGFAGRSPLDGDLRLDSDGTRHRVRDEAAIVRLVDESPRRSLVAPGGNRDTRAQEDLGHPHLPVGNGERTDGSILVAPHGHPRTARQREICQKLTRGERADEQLFRIEPRRVAAVLGSGGDLDGRPTLELDAVIARGDSFPTGVPREPGLVGVRRHGTLLRVSHLLFQPSSKKHAGKRPNYAPRCSAPAVSAPESFRKQRNLAATPLPPVGRRCASDEHFGRGRLFAYVGPRETGDVMRIRYHPLPDRLLGSLGTGARDRGRAGSNLPRPSRAASQSGVPSRPAWREPGIGRRRTGASALARPRPSERMAVALAAVPEDVPAEGVISVGPVGLIVLSLAERVPADLIVIGSHGWSTAEHASITERIIAGAPCPVLSLHEGGEGREPLRLASVRSARSAARSGGDGFLAHRAARRRIRVRPLTKRSAPSRAAARAARRTARSAAAEDAARQQLDATVPDDMRTRVATSHPPGGADNRDPGVPGGGSAAVRGARGALARRPPPPVHAGHDACGHARGELPGVDRADACRGVRASRIPRHQIASQSCEAAVVRAPIAENRGGMRGDHSAMPRSLTPASRAPGSREATRRRGRREPSAGYATTGVGVFLGRARLLSVLQAACHQHGSHGWSAAC